MNKSHDDEFRGLESVLPQAATAELRKWWDHVLLTAKKLCNDPEGRIINFNLLLPHEEQMRSKDTKKGRDCMRRAIELHLNSMPNVRGEIFMQIIKNLESKK